MPTVQANDLIFCCHVDLLSHVGLWKAPWRSAIHLYVDPRWDIFLVTADRGAREAERLGWAASLTCHDSPGRLLGGPRLASLAITSGDLPYHPAARRQGALSWSLISPELSFAAPCGGGQTWRFRTANCGKRQFTSSILRTKSFDFSRRVRTCRNSRIAISWFFSSTIPSPNCNPQHPHPSPTSLLLVLILTAVIVTYISSPCPSLGDGVSVIVTLSTVWNIDTELRVWVMMRPTCHGIYFCTKTDIENSLLSILNWSFGFY